MEKIGRYEIIRELGRGGMAVVYLARDPFMDREVAVKVLPSHLTVDPQFRARFQREAQVIAALDHPAIVPVYDFGEHEQRLFIVMRYMAGGSLADRLKKQGSFSVEETASLLDRIGRALDEAHQKGIVHRDLKPANILFDHRNQPSVGDFGIVKLSEATVAYTGESIIGTPGYMSPEQARGDGDIDGRSDIYALGAIAYEMLTGRLPYQADTPVGLMMKHIIEPVPNILDVKPGLPQSTAFTISKAMAKERGARFNTCSEIAKSLIQKLVPPFEETLLEPVTTDLAGEATVVDTPSPRPPSGVPVARPSVSPAKAPSARGGVPRWALAVGCLVLLICGGGGVTLVVLNATGFFDNNDATQVADSTPFATVADATFTPEPQVTVPVLGTTLLEISSDVAGASISYPQDWSAEDVGGIVTVASDPALLSDESNFVEGAALALFTSGEEIFESDNPVDMLNTALEDFGLAEDMTVVDGPEETQLNGYPAAIAGVTFTDDDGTPVEGLVALVKNEGRVAVLFGGSTSESVADNMPILRAIMETVELRQPTVVLTEGEVDLDNSLGVLTYGDTINGSLGPGAVAVWTLIGFQSDIVNINSQRTSGDLDVILDLWDENSQSILAEGPVDDGAVSEQLAGIQLPASGNFFIIVRSFGATSGQYELTVTSGGAATDLSEAGNLLVATDVIQATDQHIFPFTASGNNVNINATVTSVRDMDLMLSLHVADTDELVVLVDDTFSGEVLDYTVASPGFYYVGVSTADGDSGEYEMILFGPPEAIFELARGDTVYGVLGDTATLEYNLRVFVDQPFTVTIQPDGNLDVVVELYDLESSNILLDERDDGFEGEAEVLSYQPETDSVYVIIVRGFGGAVGGYTVTVE